MNETMTRPMVFEAANGPMASLEAGAMAATVQPLVIDTNVLGGITILHALQRYFKLPANRQRPNALWLAGFARDLERAIVVKHPGLKEVCDAGWQAD